MVIRDGVIDRKLLLGLVTVGWLTRLPLLSARDNCTESLTLF